MKVSRALLDRVKKPDPLPEPTEPSRAEQVQMMAEAMACAMAKQTPVGAKPVAYTFTIVRDAQGRMTSIMATPKGLSDA